MRTEGELQAFVDEVRAVCLKHGLAIFGTCENEGVYGEITIVENNFEDCEWSNAERNLSNRVYTIAGGSAISGIGDVILTQSSSPEAGSPYAPT